MVKAFSYPNAFFKEINSFFKLETGVIPISLIEPSSLYVDHEPCASLEIVTLEVSLNCLMNSKNFSITFTC